MLYKVTKQFGSGPQSQCGSFKTIAEAQAFIQSEMESVIAMKIKNVTFRILEGIDEVEAYEVDKIAQSQLESGSQGNSSSVNFNPNPLANAPRPAGVPHSWVNDKKDEKK